MGNFRKRARSRQGGLFKSKMKGKKGFKMYKGVDMKTLLAKVNTISKTIETKSGVQTLQMVSNSVTTG